MNQNFYFINWAQKKGEIILKPLEDYNEKKIKLKEFIPALPFKVKIIKGTKFYDVAYYADPFNFAISEKLNNILLENNVTGWDSYPVEIEGSDAKYFGFRVLGKCGPLKSPPGKGFVKGYEFDINGWDGSEFFCPEETLHVFFTERVKNILEAGKIKNFGIRDIATVEWYNMGEE
jgi:hypothetical protein